MHKSLGRTSSQVRNKAEFRNQYNQVLYLTQDTIWESDTELKLNCDWKFIKLSSLDNLIILGILKILLFWLLCWINFNCFLIINLVKCTITHIYFGTGPLKECWHYEGLFIDVLLSWSISVCNLTVGNHKYAFQNSKHILWSDCFWSGSALFVHDLGLHCLSRPDCFFSYLILVCIACLGIAWKLCTTFSNTYNSY